MQNSWSDFTDTIIDWVRYLWVDLFLEGTMDDSLLHQGDDAMGCALSNLMFRKRNRNELEISCNEIVSNIWLNKKKVLRLLTMLVISLSNLLYARRISSSAELMQAACALWIMNRLKINLFILFSTLNEKQILTSVGDAGSKAFDRKMRT